MLRIVDVQLRHLPMGATLGRTADRLRLLGLVEVEHSCRRLAPLRCRGGGVRGKPVGVCFDQQL
jgi:hypothetical protein